MPENPEDKVVSLDDERLARRPHYEGKARCLDCGFEFRAVTPCDMTTNGWMECEKCGLMKVRHVGHYVRTDKHHWHCGCGNDLFHITRDGAYCPACGADQQFPGPGDRGA